jgi:hypothetical protein
VIQGVFFSRITAQGMFGRHPIEGILARAEEILASHGPSPLLLLRGSPPCELVGDGIQGDSLRPYYSYKVQVIVQGRPGFYPNEIMCRCGILKFKPLLPFFPLIGRN